MKTLLTAAALFLLSLSANTPAIRSAAPVSPASPALLTADKTDSGSDQGGDDDDDDDEDDEEDFA
jgi:hypothetical protein